MLLHLVFQIVIASADNSRDEDLKLWNLWPDRLSDIHQDGLKRGTRKCHGLADVVVLVDSNSRVSNNHYTVEKIKNLMTKIIDNFDHVGSRGVQLAALSSSEYTNYFYLDSYNNIEGYKHGIHSFIPTFEGNGQAGLQTCILKIRNKFFNTAHGAGRPCAQTVIIVVSDGKITDLTETVHELKHLKYKYVTVISLAIGNSDIKALQDIATENYVFMVHDPATPNKIVDIVCKDLPCFGGRKEKTHKEWIDTLDPDPLGGPRGQVFIDEDIIDSDELKDETLTIANNQIPPEKQREKTLAIADNQVTLEEQRDLTLQMIDNQILSEVERDKTLAMMDNQVPQLSSSGRKIVSLK